MTSHDINNAGFRAPGARLNYRALDAWNLDK